MRFLQVWAQPTARGLPPRYQTGFFDDSRKLDKLCQILAPNTTTAGALVSAAGGSGPAAPSSASTETLSVDSPLRMHASILRPGARVALELPAEHRRAYVHVPIIGRTAGVEVAAPGAQPVRLAPGDGAFIEGAVGSIAFTGLGEAGAETELVVMDLP